MKHIAIDLGAESGRVIVGDLSEMDVVHRFASKAVKENGHFFWDIEEIIDEIIMGMKNAVSKYPDSIVSAGVDTWGVDYVLLDKDNRLLQKPYHYRDSRTGGIMEEVREKAGREYIYNQTGIQFMQFNTIYQLAAHLKYEPEILEKAQTFLTIPDYLNYRLSGELINELTNASTTQLFNPVTKDWAWDLIEKLGLPDRIFQKIIMPGEKLGPLQPEISGLLNTEAEISVIVPACHDTGSAVAAVPVTDKSEKYAYISSGTWSLLGYELEKPIISRQSLEINFTNESAASGGTRYLKNIMGLWVLQQCRHSRIKDKPSLSYDDIEELAEKNKGFNFSFDIDDIRFLKPNSIDDPMEKRIRNSCRENSLPVPETIGQTAKLIFTSLAEKYAETLSKGDRLTGRKTGKLYIIGGGSMQKYLCRLTADKTGIPVTAGPKEATALGNILIQAMAMGSVSGLEEGRRMILENFDLKEYVPSE